MIRIGQQAGGAPVVSALLALALVVVMTPVDARSQDSAREPSVDLSHGAPPADKTCAYTLRNWHVRSRTSRAAPRVVKPYDQVTQDERDPLEPRCTVCESDQVLIDPASLGLTGVRPFRVCHVYAEQIAAALKRIVEQGDFDLVEIMGYRPGRTRGPVVDGFRTVLSNHSFGTAIDINPGSNGLYKDCSINESVKPGLGKCSLSIGGKWDPVRWPRKSITTRTSVYREFTRFWKWGGEVPGSTRDLMHFSISGY